MARGQRIRRLRENFGLTQTELAHALGVSLRTIQNWERSGEASRVRGVRDLEELASAAPLNGTFFRSIAFRYFHPDDLISGEGTRQHGGRFVPVGVRAVYASADEDTAVREVTQRKTTLGGERQIDVGEYPRMIYLLAISTQRNLVLTHSLDPQLEAVVERCLAGLSHTAS